MVSLKVIFSQILFCALLAVTGINGKPPSAVVGGELASEKEFPYQVSLMVFGEHNCGGAIIDSTHILTAGHCVEGLGVDVIRDMEVVTGTINIQEGNHHRIKKVKVHKDFSLTPGESVDIAMITLRTPIKFNDYQKAVKLPTHRVPGNIKATASGWGILEYPSGIAPTQLWKLDMNVINNSECKIPPATIGGGHLCAMTKRGSGLCSGDSGGPLVSNGVIIGIASFVMPCGRGYPDVFTRVDHYLDWIETARKN